LIGHARLGEQVAEAARADSASSTVKNGIAQKIGER
jgi:hypothetical protein